MLKYMGLFVTRVILSLFPKQILCVYIMHDLRQTHTYNDLLCIYATIKSQGNSIVRTE